ncbi:Receptor-like protein 43 [Linum perenne]
MASVVVAVLVIGSLCHLCSFVSPTQTLCLDSERTLLVQIKHEIFINTSFWGIQPLPSPKVWSWNDSRNHKDCCLWEGITCDSYSGHVVGLDLSSSNIVGGINSSSSIFHLHHLQSLSLAHNRLDISGSSFPYGFNNLSSLIHLNLSHAGFGGSIPEYDISTLGMLVSLDLSNFASSVDMEKLVKNLTRLRVLKLDGLDLSPGFTNKSLSLFPHLIHLDLSWCRLYGTLSSSIFLIHNLQFLDVSYNYQLTGSLPEFPVSNIQLQTIILLNLSSNKINGNISPSLCDMKFLAIIDLSSNHLNGSIPSCLVSLESLGVLSLKNNKLSGMLPKDFAHGCSLMTLDVNQNNIEGQIPESLGFCPYLEVVDVGKNNLTGKFPFWLEDLPALRVLVLHSNKFGGSIDSQNPTGFPVLQILDVSFNKFVGKLPSRWFRSWNGMMKSSTTGNYIFSGSSSYQNSVTVIVKGTEREYPKILNIFVLLDVSNNNFVGEIPETIGHLESLELLNLSNNHFTGHIPQSFEQLRKLESLDFSSNNLSGSIPSQLTKLTFLSVFNTSHNSLSGEIPIGKQFDTFDANSYLGNRELCGKPLPKPCFEVKSAPSSATSPTVKGWKSMIDWNCFRDGTACGWGAGVILGIVIAKLVYGNPFIPPKTKRVRRIAVRPLRNYS